MKNTTNQNPATAAPDDRRARYQGKSLAQMSYQFARKARADNTQRSYKSAQTQFRTWCYAQEIEPDDITDREFGYYLCWLAVEQGYPPGTIRCKLSGIRRWFRDRQGRENVTVSDHVRAVWDGIQREFSQRPSQAAALTLDLIREIIEAMPGRDGVWSMRNLRDRALMLVGYGGAFRRSELASLRVEDVQFEDSGLLLFLRKSKTDQVSRGVWVGIGHGQGGTCPVAALQAWLDAAPHGEHVFRQVTRWGKVPDEPLSHHAINLLVKGWLELIGRDPAEYSAHSLRAGICTDLTAAGVSQSLIMERTRHTSPVMLGVYNRPRSALASNFTRLAGL